MGVKVNLSRDVPADHDDPNMNIIQAIKNSSRIVADPKAVAELRSVHLCWLLHLVGDAHQPLHSSALFTSSRFPEGDHGGNYLNIEHDYKLHGFWDDQVSTEEPYDTVRRLAAEVGRNAELAAAGQQRAAALDPGHLDRRRPRAGKAVCVHAGGAREDRGPRGAFPFGRPPSAGELLCRGGSGVGAAGGGGRASVGGAARRNCSTDEAAGRPTNAKRPASRLARRALNTCANSVLGPRYAVRRRAVVAAPNSASAASAIVPGSGTV